MATWKSGRDGRFDIEFFDAVIGASPQIQECSYNAEVLAKLPLRGRIVMRDEKERPVKVQGAIVLPPYNFAIVTVGEIVIKVGSTKREFLVKEC